jgi:hypothetical protein
MGPAGSPNTVIQGANTGRLFLLPGTVTSPIAEKLINQGIEKGIDKGKWNVVLNMLRKGIDIPTIEELIGFTAAQIKEFKERMQGQQLNAAA